MKAKTSFFRSMRSQIAALLLVSYMIPVLLLGGFSGSVLLRQLRIKTESALTTGVEHAWGLTVQNIDRIISLAREATYDGELTEIQNHRLSGELGDSEFLRQCRGYLDRKYSRESLFQFAMFFPLDRPELLAGTRTGSSESAASLQAFRESVSALGDTLDTRLLFIEHREKLYLVRNLLTLKMERFGMLILEVNRERLFAPLESLKAEWKGDISLLLDDYGDLDPARVDASPGLTDHPGENALEYFRKSSGTQDYDFRMCLRLKRHELYREMYLFRLMSALVCLALIPIFLLLMRYVRTRITKPIALLSDASRRIEEGELGVTVPMHGGDELGNLGVSFSHMSLRLKELIEKTYKEEIELKNAQIRALQSRINPHFINNALEDINWQARMDGSETTSAMVTSLSVLLNAAMDRKDRRTVTLREELEVADAYIYFIQQRFGADLEIIRDVEEAAVDAVLPLLTIQPVLENAVEHGIAPAGGGRILIRARLTESRLHIEIINSGKGIEPGDRARIEAALRGEKDSAHLGLANIASRLRLICGDSARIRVDTESSGETAVRMDIPAAPAADRTQRRDDA